MKIYKMFVKAGTGQETEQGISAKDLYVDLHGGEQRRSAWESYIAAAEHHNSPGEFTALIGWEWSSMPKGGNLHRVIFMAQGGETARKFLPYSQMESENPEDLWAWLDKTSAETGADFVAIPHNSNLSIGQVFPLLRYNGQAVDLEYARKRMQWEPVVEATTPNITY